MSVPEATLCLLWLKTYLQPGMLYGLLQEKSTALKSEWKHFVSCTPLENFGTLIQCSFDHECSCLSMEEGFSIMWKQYEPQQKTVSASSEKSYTDKFTLSVLILLICFEFYSHQNVKMKWLMSGRLLNSNLAIPDFRSLKKTNAWHITLNNSSKGWSCLLTDIKYYFNQSIISSD